LFPEPLRYPVTPFSVSLFHGFTWNVRCWALPGENAFISSPPLTFSRSLPFVGPTKDFLQTMIFPVPLNFLRFLPPSIWFSCWEFSGDVFLLGPSPPFPSWCFSFFHLPTLGGLNSCRVVVFRLFQIVSLTPFLFSPCLNLLRESVGVSGFFGHFPLFFHYFFFFVLAFFLCEVSWRS